MKSSLFQIIFILLVVEILMFPSAAFSSSFSIQEINSAEIADEIANSPQGKEFTKNTNLKLDKIIKEELDKLKNKAGKDHTVPVIIGLKTNFIPEGKMSFASVEFQKSKIKLDQDELVKFLSGYKLNKIHKFEHVPFISMTVDKETLERLESSPLIATVSEDVVFKPTLTDSVPLIGATTAWGDGFSGQGQTIGILDTGVDKNHSFLTGKVVSEACFSSNVEDDPATTTINEESFSLCQGGVSELIGPDAGLPCAITGCDHGTHVAGIAAGNDLTTISGVAKDANIISIQVFSLFTVGGLQTYVSDVVKGLDHIASLRLMYDVSSVNLSLGGGAFFSECDADINFLSLKQSVDNLRSFGIVTVASSGNDGSSSFMGAPACLSNIVSVGSTTKSDFVSSFSNTPSFLDLLAPGSSIESSSFPGGGFVFQSGTSMATPHVAGAWAIIKSSDQGATIDQVFDSLKRNGVPVTHNSMTFPRIQVDSAISDLNCTSGWFICNWQFRKQITIDSTQVSSDLTDFPVLVKMTDANLASSAQASGYDIVFTASDGTTKLSHEIEEWDNTAGELTAWVNVPFLSSSTDTSLYMYYGNPATLNQQDLTGGTWNSDYKMVQHMQENPSLVNPAMIDSTSNGNDLDAIGMESGDLVQAKIGKGLSFDSTTSEYLQKNPFNDISGTTITWSMWMRSSDTTMFGTPLSYAASTANNNEWLLLNYNGFLIFLKGVSQGWSGESAADSMWHHIAVTRSGTQVDLFKDGVNVFSSNSGSPNSFTTGGCLVVGQEQDTLCGGFQSSQDFEGEMDELRVSSIAQPDGWIATEYINQNDPGTFITVGGEEIINPNPTIPDPINDLVAVPGDSEIILTWTEPADGGSTITDYIVEFKESADPNFMIFDDGVNPSTGATVTDLTNGVSYDFKVKAENGIGQGQDSNIVTETPISSCPTDWFDCDWQFRKQIIVDSTKVMTPLTNFAVLVKMTDANLASSAQASGDDIVFTLSDGTTKLSHEIEEWDNTTDDLAAWVNVPFLSSSTDTVLYVYYGNPSVSNQQDLTGGTWNSDYKMVQHMQENPSLVNPAMIDSTSNGNDLDAIGMESGDLVQAKIGKGLSFDSTTSEYLQKNPFNDISGTTITTSFWMRTSDTTWGTPLSYAASAANNNEWLLLGYNSFLIFLKGVSQGWSGQSAADSMWHHIAVTRSGTQVDLFKDGVNVFSSNSGSPNSFTTGGCLVVGQEQDTLCGGFQSSQDFEGEMDELRVSSIAQPDGWIATEYINQNDPGNFISVGMQETTI